MDVVKTVLLVAAAGLLAACADPAYRTTDASAGAQAVDNDSLAAEMMTDDPLSDAGALQDTTGTTIP